MYLEMLFLAIVTAITILAVIKRSVSVYSGDPEECNPMQGKKVRFVADESEK